MCERVVSEDPFLVVYCPDKYKTQRMCDKTVDDSLVALKLTSEMIKELFVGLYANENILYFNEGSNNVIFSCNEMSILNIDLNNINLDSNFDKDDPDAIIITRILAWHIKFEKRKELRKR